MKGFILDDEAKCRRLLLKMCEDYCTDLCIVGEAGSVSEALPLIDIHKPDLVFLDIQLPDQNGFELLDHYKNNIPFEVVFTTAYDQYALEAFKYMAIDYLLKPIDVTELQEAVERAKKVCRLEKGRIERMIQVAGAMSSGENEKIALATLEGFTFVKFQDIIRCEAHGNYTSVHLLDGTTLLITKTLKHYEEILKHKDFFRVHKSHLVNLKYVRKFLKGKQGKLETIDGKIVEVSTRKREALLNKLSALLMIFVWFLLFTA